MDKEIHPKNRLNDLTGKEWIRFTKSWFIHNPPPRSQSEIQHPAKFPEDMIGEFIKYFTKPGEIVFDPFMGVGSTILAAALQSRKGIGIELNRKYFEFALEHLGLFRDMHIMINDDAARIPGIWRERKLPPADLIITSPPYWDMLAHSRGNVFSTHKARKAKGLDTVYSSGDERDLGCIGDYRKFVQSLRNVFKKAAGVLREGRYLVVVAQNLRDPSGRMIRLGWDLAGELDRFLVFKGEKIWCQDNKKLGIWGYPSEFVLNVHHHYCLIFKKQGKP